MRNKKIPSPKIEHDVPNDGEYSSIGLTKIQIFITSIAITKEMTAREPKYRTNGIIPSNRGFIFHLVFNGG
jgi:hypothetical protein